MNTDTTKNLYDHIKNEYGLKLAECELEEVIRLAQLCPQVNQQPTKRKPTQKTIETEKYVDEYIEENGYPPTYEEIVQQFNLKSTSAAYNRCRAFRNKMRQRINKLNNETK